MKQELKGEREVKQCEEKKTLNGKRIKGKKVNRVKKYRMKKKNPFCTFFLFFNVRWRARL